MRYLDEFPHPVDVLDHVEIEMRDGIRLSARIWLPKSAGSAPVPAILEYIPYRKRFSTAPRDEVTHGYLSGYGYACVRVDLRGSGESDGVLEDEYLQQELDDGVAVIEWIAAQTWCDGNVGMMGISWGGFNALQIAALRPPALKAVMSASSTDDRYADDVHHMGGCLLGDNLSWASVMLAYNSIPPDPMLVGERWREIWQERLEGSGFWLAKWLAHARRDEYWKHGSIKEDYEAIQCPVLLVSGWADGYTNAVFRMLENLRVPRLGLVGPWAHTYPHFGRPGPAIDFLHELKRWWDHWLKDEPTGIMDEPMLRAWMQDSVPPTTAYEERPGRWVGEKAWPSDSIQIKRFTLTENHLHAEGDNVDASSGSLSVQSPLSLGMFAGKWCSYAAGPDLAHDQREEDGGALVFETKPFPQPIEILGRAEVRLSFSVDRPVAMVAARLSDIAPNGGATRFTYGLRNLAHLDDYENPRPLEPGRRYDVRVRLNDIGQHIPAGHKLRLSLSTSYWPLAWPPPEPVMLHIHLEETRLEVPVRPRRREDAHIELSSTPVGARPSPRRLLKPEQHDWVVHRHLASDESTLEVIDDRGVYLHEATGLTIGTKALERYTACGNDFDSVTGETWWERTMERGDWCIRTKTHTLMTSNAEAFELQGDIDAYEGDRRVFCRSWRVSIPRDLV